MLKLESNWLDLRTLDELALQKTFIHKLNACTKLYTTLIFVVIVTSFSKYEITGLIPLFFYPIALISLGNLPIHYLCKRLLVIAPFIIVIGLFNPLFDHVPVTAVGSLMVTGGWLSFAGITLKLMLTITAALLLVATTGINPICSALIKLGAPKPIVIQILFMYRYIHVLLEEFLTTLQAYHQRSLRNDGVHYKAWGSLLGQLLLRTMARAQRIYQAMLCRGYDGHIGISTAMVWTTQDKLFLFFWPVFFLFCRFINIPQALGKLLTGGF